MSNVQRNLPEAHTDVAPPPRVFHRRRPETKSPRGARAYAAGAFIGGALLLGTALGAFKWWSPAAYAASPPAAPQPTTKKAKVDKTDAFFKSGLVPRLRLEIGPKELDALRKDPRAYVRCKVHELPAAAVKGDNADKGAKPDKNGKADKGEKADKDAAATVYEDVGVHVKGALGSFRGIDDRPALTLNFDKFKKGQKFHGLDKLHLNNSVQDPTYLSEAVGAAVFREAGLPAARVTHAYVKVNDRDHGLYVVKEGFDREFLARHFKDRDGTFFEGNLQDIDQNLPIKSNTDPKNDQKRKELVEAARENDPAKRRQRLEKVLDVDRFHTLLALEAMLAHWDGYGFNKNNYRIYHAPKADKLVFLPHGMDQLFGNPGHPLLPGGGLVAGALLALPEERAKYFERVAELREKVFTPEKLAKHVDDAAARVLPAVEQENKDRARQFQDGANQLRQRAIERVKHIDRELGATPKPLKFDAGGVASLAKAVWSPGPGQGGATADRFDEGEKPRLRVRSQGGGVASWRTTVLLPKGRYVFEGNARPKGVTAPDGPGTGAGLRISGGQRTARLTGTGDWQKAEYEFEVAEPTREVVLVCELKGNAGEVSFDPESLKLRRK